MLTRYKVTFLAFALLGCGGAAGMAQDADPKVVPAVSREVKPPVARVIPEDVAEPIEAPETLAAMAAPGADPKITPAPSGKDVEGITRVQIFLDAHNFGPGKIDGEMGEFQSGQQTAKR
jgi:hypothetical protein